MPTASATLETRVQLFCEQAFDYFTRPVRTDELTAPVEPALGMLEAYQEEDDNDRRE